MLVQLRGLRSAKQANVPLVDPQGRMVRYLRISLTDHCNYRCTYCLPETDIEYSRASERLTVTEIVHLCQAFARWGVERVRLTGGEPTLRKDLVTLVEQLTQIMTSNGRLKVTLTTNGHLLADLAQPLFAAGLSSLTVSLDSLHPVKFAKITRRGHLEEVLKGLAAAHEAGFASIKLNTVAIKGFNEDELTRIAEYAWNHHWIPRFIEVMPMAAGTLYIPGQLLRAEEVRAQIADDLKTSLCADAGDEVRGLGPATYWRVSSGPYQNKLLGTIAAMSENFCSSCNRLRISATGQLHNCLAHDETGDLRMALRSANPDALARQVQTILQQKQLGHRFTPQGCGGPTKAMISIGG